jgi:hypothetical protein
VSAMTEAQWRSVVLDLALLCGWRAYCVENTTREIVRRSGARIRVRNVNAMGVGFPDLVLVRRRDARLIFAELKRDRTGHEHRLTPEQNAWLDDLRAVADHLDEGTVAGVEVYVWRPSDLETVKEILR